MKKTIEAYGNDVIITEKEKKKSQLRIESIKPFFFTHPVQCTPMLYEHWCAEVNQKPNGC